MSDLGRSVYATAAVWIGLVGLFWQDFATYWQPVPEDVPGRTAVACVVAIAFSAAGIAMLVRRTAAGGGLMAAALFTAAALLWVKRVIYFPGIFGTWGGCAEEIAQAIGGLLVFLAARKGGALSDRLKAWCVVAFGACAICFGILHFEALPQTAAMVPPWLPLGGTFWAMATGVFHAAGGLALVIGVMERLAARLLTAMYAGFSLLVWLPKLPGQFGEHIPWAGNGVNLALVGAAWLVADHVAARQSLPSLGWRRRRASASVAMASATPAP